VVRSINLLEPPESLLSNPEVIGRVMKVWNDRENRERRQLELGPPRDEMLRALAEAA
jgi:hypothetical protein